MAKLGESLDDSNNEITDMEMQLDASQGHAASGKKILNEMVRIYYDYTKYLINLGEKRCFTCFSSPRLSIICVSTLSVYTRPVVL